MSIFGAIFKTVAKKVVPTLAKKAAPQVAKKVGLSAGQKWAIGVGATIFGGYEVTLGEQRRIENREEKENKKLFDKKQDIWNDQDINRFDRAWRRIKSWFSDQDVESQTRKYLDDQYTNNPEELQNAGREYIKELLGPDIKNLTPKEKEKRYREALREFYMQLTSLGLDQERSEQILAGAIGELQSDTRSRAVKDFIELGASATSINNRAKYAQQCALFNLTNKDAFDNIPDQQQAVEYQFQTFSHMRDIDVQEAISNLNQVKDIYKKLQENGFDINCLSEHEKSLLQGIQDFDVIKQNYLTGGYAGAYAGIPANGYILGEDGNPNTAFVQELLSQIYNATEDLGISNEVFCAVHEFVSSNSDVETKINEVHGQSFEILINEATGGAYQSYLVTHCSGNSASVSSNLTGSYDGHAGIIPANGINSPTAVAYEIKDGSTKIDNEERNTSVTNPIKGGGYIQQNELVSPQIGKQEQTGYGGVGAPIQSPGANNVVAAENNSISRPSLCSSRCLEMKHAVEKGYFQAYVRENNVKLRDILNFVFSSDVSDDSLKDKYFEEFKNIGNFSDMLNVYKSLNGKAKRAILFRIKSLYLVDRLSKSDYNADIDTIEYAKELLAEAQREGKDCDNLTEAHKIQVA